MSSRRNTHPDDIYRQRGVILLFSGRKELTELFFVDFSEDHIQHRHSADNTTLLAVILAIFVIIMCYKYFQSLKNYAASSTKKILFNGGDLKQVYLVRSDLQMGKGKIAAQCCHAAVKAYRELANHGSDAKSAVERWEWQGSRKVVVKVASEEELKDIILSAKQKGLYATTIRDAGKTQIAAGSMTVGVIGPATESDIDEISGHLKLL